MGREKTPLRFRDGSLVRTISELKDRFRTDYSGMLLFVEGGEMERFLHGQAEDPLRDIVRTMKAAGTKASEIVSALAEKLCVVCEIRPECLKDEVIVSASTDLKALLEGTAPEILLPRGNWTCSEPITIKTGKTIIGQGENASLIKTAGLAIDIPKRETVTFGHLCLQNTSGDGRVIRVSASQVCFEHVRFEGVVIEAVEGSIVKLVGSRCVDGCHKSHASEDSRIECDTLQGGSLADSQGGCRLYTAGSGDSRKSLEPSQGDSSCDVKRYAKKRIKDDPRFLTVKAAGKVIKSITDKTTLATFLGMEWYFCKKMNCEYRRRGVQDTCRSRWADVGGDDDSDEEIPASLDPRRMRIAEVEAFLSSNIDRRSLMTFTGLELLGSERSAVLKKCQRKLDEGSRSR